MLRENGQGNDSRPLARLLTGEMLSFQSEAERGPSVPHDIAVSPTGRDVYIADVLQQAVHKFNFTQPLADRKYFG